MKIRTQPWFRTVGRARRALSLWVLIIISAWLAYMIIGLSAFDALYQTTVTITTVGYAEIGTNEASTTYRAVTLAVMVLGVGTTFYALGVAVEMLLEGRIEELFGRRKMDREIANMRGHVVVCGCGRVGSQLVDEILDAGKQLVVIDSEASSHNLPPSVSTIDGDATDDAVLRAAGVEHASTLVTALSSDSDNVYVTLSARAMRPDVFIVARAHAHSAEDKLTRAGADRVVNPQFIGGRRMATYALSPNVAEFLDVTMHDGDVEWRLEEVTVTAQSTMVGKNLGKLGIRDTVGCLILALRMAAGFVNNPGSDVELSEGTLNRSGNVACSNL